MIFQRTEPSTFRTCCLALAAVLVGQAIGFGARGFSPTALLLVALAIFVIAQAISRDGPAHPAILRGLMLLAFCGGLMRLALDDAYIHDSNARQFLRQIAGMAVLAAMIALGVFCGRSSSLVLGSFVLLMAVYALMAIFTVNARVPGIDVYDIQMLGCNALTHGRDPFAITFPDRYGPDAGFYPPGVVVGGQVQCGYFYPPLSLLLDIPGYLLAGDVRYSHASAMILSALLIAWMAPGRFGVMTFGPAVMLMFSPRIFYQLQVGWTEPFVVLPLCATVFCAVRGWRTAAAAMLGLFFASKQYAIFAAPAALLLIRRPWTAREITRWAVIAAATGCAVTLPFVLWDPQAFYRSMTILYGGVFRDDSISFLPRLARAIGLRPSLAFSVLAAIPPIAFTLWRAPRSPSGFAASTALTLLCVFAFSAQAFGNYYLVVVAALCCALAATSEPLNPAPQEPYRSHPSASRRPA